MVWFTGLSGAGKSTIANIVERKLHAEGRHTYLLDGDNLRHGLNKDLGFTTADRVENVRRTAEVASLMADAGLIVLVSLISPYRAERRMARDLAGDNRFLEIYVDTPLEVAESRDRKGLYAKARRGEIPNFTGIGAPYEAPENPDLHISTDEYTPEEAADAVIRLLSRCRLRRVDMRLRTARPSSAVLRLGLVAGRRRVHRVVADQRVGEPVVEGRRPSQVERLPDGPDRALNGLRVAAGDGQCDFAGPRREGRPVVTTSVTRPRRSAVAAVMRSSFPMRAQRSTSPSGTPRCSMPIGSSALTIPTLACGSKNTASSEQMTMSDSLTKYWAPPAQSPCTAQTTGFQTLWWSFGLSETPGSKLFQAFSFMNHGSGFLMSVPVPKARSPLACSTTQWMSSVSRTVSQAHVMSAAMASLKELRLSGRFRVMVATCSATSNKIVSRSKGSSWRRGLAAAVR